MREPILTKHGRVVLVLFGIGLGLLIWARVSGFSESGFGALCTIFAMSVIGGLVRFIFERRAVQEAHFADRERQLQMLQSPFCPPEPADYEATRLLTAPQANPEQEH